MNIHIREATNKDIAGITRLTNQLGYIGSEAFTAENFAQIQQTKNGVVYVAVDEDNLTGWLHVSKVVTLESGCFYEILGLVVDETHRNHGFGKLLLQQAIQWSRNGGAELLRVRSNIKRREAHSFYIKLGFIEMKEQKVFSLSFTT